MSPTRTQPVSRAHEALITALAARGCTIAAVSTLFLLVGCYAAGPSSPAEVTIEPELLATETRQIMVQGKTNLPDGVSLTIMIYGERYHNEAVAITKAGKFSAGPFGAQTGLFPSGEYKLRIVAVVPTWTEYVTYEVPFSTERIPRGYPL